MRIFLSFCSRNVSRAGEAGHWFAAAAGTFMLGTSGESTEAVARSNMRW